MVSRTATRFSFPKGASILLDAMCVALVPLLWGKETQPFWYYFCQAIERSPQRLPNTHGTIDHPDSRQDMGRICSLLSSRFGKPSLSEGEKQRLKQEGLCMAFDETRAKLGEGRKIKAALGEF